MLNKTKIIRKMTSLKIVDTKLVRELILHHSSTQMCHQQHRWILTTGLELVFLSEWTLIRYLIINSVDGSAKVMKCCCITRILIPTQSQQHIHRVITRDKYSYMKYIFYTKRLECLFFHTTLFHHIYIYLWLQDKAVHISKAHRILKYANMTA